MLHLNEPSERFQSTWQSEFSLAHVLAIAATAGVTCEFTRVDIHGADATLTAEVRDARWQYPKLDLQIKSWTTPRERDGCYSYPLRIENYRKLRIRTHAPRILVVVVMPPSREDWFGMADEQCILRHCAYWKSLVGEPPVPNAYQKTVQIPKRDQFSVDALRAMMERIAHGGGP